MQGVLWGERARFFSKYKKKALQDEAESRKRDESVWGTLFGLDSPPSFLDLEE